MHLTDLAKEVKQLELYTNRRVNDVFAGNYKSSFKGQGIEVKNLRSYVDGDDAKQIDWLTTARMGKTFVKEFHETRELTTFVLVDLSASMNFGKGKILKKDVVAKTTAMLLFSALKNNDNFGALFFSDKIESYIPAKKGQAHFLRILRDLIWHYDHNAYKQADHQDVLKFFNNVVKKQSISFLLSDELNLDTGKGLRIANTKHDFVFINIYDPLERQLPDNGLILVEDPETGAQSLVNFSNLKTRQRYSRNHQKDAAFFESILKSNSIDLLNLSTQDDIFKQLLLFFKKRQLRR